MNKQVLKKLMIVGSVLIILTAIFLYLMHSIYHQRTTLLEINAISDVLRQVKNDRTLVVFDIDNTLAYPGQELGSDPWVYRIVKQKMEKGVDSDAAIQELLPLYYHVHNYIEMQPVEADTISVLEQLRAQSIHFIALTSRSLPLVERTHEQLRSAGIFFNPPQELNIDMTVENAKRPAILSQGIIFCTDNDKGEMLEKVFKQLHLNLPERIVYVDDKQKYLESVANCCKKENIEFVGLRYGYLDSFVKEFAYEKAEHQLTTLLEDHPFMDAEPCVS